VSQLPGAVPVPRSGVVEWDKIPGLQHGFFGRRGGSSRGAFASLNVSDTVGDEPDHVRANWSALGRVLPAQLRWARMRQVHGARVVTLGEGVEAAGEADAMVTSQAGLALTILTADCVPILFVEPRQRVVGVAHAGWRGTLANVAGATVERLRQEYGIEPREIHAALGPSIGSCCFEVGDGVAAQFEGLGEDVRRSVHCETGSKSHMDLRRINELLLQRAGVPSEQISTVGPCTRCHPQDYFSFRGEQGHTGRQASVIAFVD